MANLSDSEVSARVKSKLIELLPSGKVNEEVVAGSLNMSLRSLQRKLSDENVSYKELLESTRMTLALEYIKLPKYSINEITYLLGFSEQSNFSRAFKRWTKQTPTSYRANI